MKILVVYYSRTGTTKKMAEAIASKLGAEIEEIKDTINRSGIKGYAISGRDAMKRKLTKLESIKLNPADYDLVIVGTPIWAWNVSVPIRTYLNEQKDKFKQTAFFCTMGGTGDEKAFSEMEGIVGKKPKAVLSVLTREAAKGDYSKKLDNFLNELSVV
jgi:flavodoxin